MPAAALPPKWAVAGMTFTGARYCPNVTLGSAASLASMRHLRSTGAEWVSLVATQYQWNITSTRIFPLYNASEVYDVDSQYYTFVTVTDGELRAAILSLPFVLVVYLLLRATCCRPAPPGANLPCVAYSCSVDP